jgi:hypothetical protein
LGNADTVAHMERINVKNFSPFLPEIELDCYIEIAIVLMIKIQEVRLTSTTS